MSVLVQVGIQLPYLRRYARALTGSQKLGDEAVRKLLEIAVNTPNIRKTLLQGRVGLYTAFTRSLSNAIPISTDDASSSWHEQKAQSRLSHIAPLQRQALLLTTLEDFTREEASQVLGISVEEVNRAVTEVIRNIENETATGILIIEDEPLISMQLEALVLDMGHTITGTAATRAQAQDIFAKEIPGLVLADIQLRDGSSGIDAVEDLMSLASVPTIFITAYPERLLTGERPEPTYIITKPFQENTVKAAISQALFFETSKPILP